MTEREKFEQWCKMMPRQWPTDRWGDAVLGDYKDRRASIAWESWEAATDASTHKAIYEDEV